MTGYSRSIYKFHFFKWNNLVNACTYTSLKSKIKKKKYKFNGQFIKKRKIKKKLKKLKKFKQNKIQF
jgi:hypothetical protein